MARGNHAMDSLTHLDGAELYFAAGTAAGALAAFLVELHGTGKEMPQELRAAWIGLDQVLERIASARSVTSEELCRQAVLDLRACIKDCAAPATLSERVH